MKVNTQKKSDNSKTVFSSVVSLMKCRNDIFSIIFFCAGGFAISWVVRKENVFGSSLDISIADIFFHNVALACFCVIAGVWVSRLVIGISALMLGYGAGLSFVLRGTLETCVLLFPHTFIEMLAWIVTIMLSKRVWDMGKDMWRTGEWDSRNNFPRIYRIFMIVIALYGVAAVCEYVEYVIFNLLRS